MRRAQPWRKVRAAFGTLAVRDRIRDADAFWHEFRSRAPARAAEPDTVRRTAAGPWSRPGIWRWALAGACGMLVAAWVTLRLFLMGAVSEPNTIKSLDVGVSHSAVLILNDEPSQSTILWVAGMEMRDQT